ncbi:hypothetical protein DPMN_057164 [Dreissena polymorpha]|uniref:Uncharacterized protein n=1 Tax=Dreissena polymorpha TaxID=45954 RepID=A0A9D4HVS4_DREPO|nr:hypothetical protein DPMN_057164 [Dreissena polymorpha]
MTVHPSHGNALPVSHAIQIDRFRAHGMRARWRVATYVQESPSWVLLSTIQA